MAGTEARRREALDRFEKVTELPLLALALAMIPLIILPLTMDLPESVETAFIAFDWFIWAVFAFEYIVRLTLTTERKHFVRREWASLLFVVVPLLRPLRIMRSAKAVRALRLARFSGYLGIVTKLGRRLLVRQRVHYVLLSTLVLVLGAAIFVFEVERNSDGAIDSFGDALWWSMATITTVGYGDEAPTTGAGRGVGIFLMLAGIGFFGVITANLAAIIMKPAPEETQAELDRLDEILLRLEAIERRLTDRERVDDMDLVDLESAAE